MVHSELEAGGEAGLAELLAVLDGEVSDGLDEFHVRFPSGSSRPFWPGKAFGFHYSIGKELGVVE
ncbi:hypothetical protein GCM10010345_11730 [Streptomyces canarius]|uniref:Uncharacterized protein n=1 Tax=Streptomyces canarius TaxID=285453 RepID=A0ABQ3CKN8_9ACTN|nr:hypothetical protein GCM10010345_11730 [Streptomyces canarius]